MSWWLLQYFFSSCSIICTVTTPFARTQQFSLREHCSNLLRKLCVTPTVAQSRVFFSFLFSALFFFLRLLFVIGRVVQWQVIDRRQFYRRKSLSMYFIISSPNVIFSFTNVFLASIYKKRKTIWCGYCAALSKPTEAVSEHAQKSACW